MTQAMNRCVVQALQKNGGKYDSWSLYFDKFSGYSTKKEDTLKDVKKHYKASKESLETAIEQKHTLFKNLEQSKKVKIIYLENRSRLLVNMGHSCVLENVGFSFERISGLPYVPGSALKGVVSNWAIWDKNGDAAFAEDLKGFSTDRSKLDANLIDIFGANGDDDAEQGKVNFYGIFPMEVPTLEIDILTPHQGRITPNHFLTVAAGTKWMIPIAMNRGDESLLNETEAYIEKCLCNYGVGAKTASGYGKFEAISPSELQKIQDEFKQRLNTQAEAQKLAKEKQEQDNQKEEEDKQKRLQEKERRNNLSPEERAFEDFCENIIDESDFKGKVAKIAESKEQEQRFICKLLQTTYQHVWKSALKDFAKGEKKGKKGYKRAKAVKEIAKDLGVSL